MKNRSLYIYLSRLRESTGHVVSNHFSCFFLPSVRPATKIHFVIYRKCFITRLKNLLCFFNLFSILRVDGKERLEETMVSAAVVVMVVVVVANATPKEHPVRRVQPISFTPSIELFQELL